MTDSSNNVLQRGLEKIHDPFSSFIRAQTTTSWVLLLATIVALWWANSDYYSTYQNLTHTSIGFFLGDFKLQASLKHIINDGLMVIFFFLLGLEIKREVLAGDLARPENRRMLILCAVGGMVCPAIIYSLFNWSHDSQIGWGIPIATWWMMLKSGVHPTFAGVAIALTVPARPKFSSEKLLVKAKKKINSIQKKSKPVDVLGSRTDHEQVLEARDFSERASTPLRRWEDALELPVALFVLPLFVLTNAGVPFSLNSFIESVQHPTGLGIITGLVLGKLIGISGACWLGLHYKIGCLPDGVNLQHVIGVSLIAGIGFTMSTFIATLGFDSQPVLLQSAKSSILVASLTSAILGVLYIRFVAAKKHNTSLNSTPKSGAN